MHPTIIRVDSQQFITNLQSIRQLIGQQVKLCLPVKANAYGHGLCLIAKLAANYVDYLALACLDEGISLRQAGIVKPILVFGAFTAEQIPQLIEYDLEFSISSLYKAELVANYCAQANKQCKVHLKIDTGMNRVGIRVASSYALIDFVWVCPNIQLVGVYSHLAASDELDNPLTQQQITEFKPVVAYVKQLNKNILCHIANSGGVCYFPDSYLDMVRPGLLSYGYFPAQKVAQLAMIAPCFSLISHVVYFKTLARPQGISYNHRYVAEALSRIATIPIGYGDGYRRGLSNLGAALIRSRRYPIAGNVCMDMLMLDLGLDGEAYVGDEVVLIGKQGELEISINELATKLNTIIYEILVGFNERIPRIMC